ncbi:beta strand repeat-containing protein [Deinococcus sp. UYEF24]
MMRPYRTLLSLLTLSLAASAGAVGTSAGNTISNTGYVDYVDDTGASSTAASTPVSATVAQVFAVSVTPDSSGATPGQTVYTAGNTTGTQTTALKYVLSNPGNGTDTFNITTAAVSANVTAANVKYYLDNTATGGGSVIGSYDATDTLISGPVNLAADGTKVFFAVYTTPANDAAGTQYDVTPAATSTGDNTKTDVNNLGRIITKSVYDLTFTATQAKNITTPGTAVYVQTLTNTGNAPLTAAQILLSASAADTVSGTGAFTQSYTVTVGGTTSASFATPQAALNSALGAGTLAPGAALTLNTTVTANNALASGNREILTLGAAITGVTNSATANNNVPALVLVTDTSTVIKGLGTITKTQALCGTSGSTTAANCPASSGASTTAITVKPGDYVVYYLSATNTGTGSIFATKVRDALPAGVSIYSLAATSTQAGTMLYSINGTAWTGNATSLSVPNGATVYAAVDTNTDGTITSADTLTTGGSVLFRIKVTVNGTVNTTPASDPQTVN